MASSSNSSKRKIALDTPISPPLAKRKVQSTTTQNAVASFFTPTSSKPPEKIIWTERAPDDDTPSSLLVGKYQPASDSKSLQNARPNEKRRKVAAFDFASHPQTGTKASSLIAALGFHPHPDRIGKEIRVRRQDWKWWHSVVPGRLQKLYLEDGFRVVIITNQGGLALRPDNKSKAPKANHTTKLTSFKAKASTILNQLDIPISIYAATGKDIYRKPRTGSWKELLDDYDIHAPGDVDLENSIFVGDAGGRLAGAGKPKDFSCSDRNFAENVGITFHTPEEFFLNEAPREFSRAFIPSEYLRDLSAAEAPGVYFKKNDNEIVLLCGSPGAGKSTFYLRQLQPLRFERVNQDILGTREKCIKAAGQLLDEGKSVAVDNTNPDSEVRGKWVELAKRHGVPIRCVLFTASAELCEHNNAVRALNRVMNPEKRPILPDLAFKGFLSRYQRPSLSEGFQDIVEVAFEFDGSEAEREIWTRHWT